MSVAVPTSELVKIRVVAEMLGGCSVRHVRRLADSGRMPSPVKLGALLRFNRDSVAQWIAAGCPRVRPLAKGR